MLCLAGVGGEPAFPQRVVRPAPPTGARATAPVTASRRVAQNLKRADELIEQKRFADALPYLQSLLDEPGDVFLPGAPGAPMTSPDYSRLRESLSLRVRRTC
jgi:hypothetical protein